MSREVQQHLPFPWRQWSSN